MIKLFKFFFPTLLLIVSLNSFNVSAEDLKVHFFHSEICPHCKKEDAFLKIMEDKYPIYVEKHEVTKEKDDIRLFIETAKKLNANTSSVPFLVIGEEYIVGYLNDETTGRQIEDLIVSALDTPGSDAVEEVKDEKFKPEKEKKQREELILNLPVLGKINTKDFSLPAITFVIALLDGFNPCAMWVLIFLISMLLGMKDRTKMWILGITFILASGFVYFLFLSAWLSFFLFLGYSTMIRVGIGFLASGIGIYYLWDYYKNRGVCKIAENEKRQKMFEKIKNVIQERNLLLAMGGIILLAFAVNIIELLCSAGLPAVFTQILTMNKLPTWQYYMYLLEYIVIFMLDDMVVFALAMVTLQSSGIGGKYSQYSHLIGGILMAIIGILMLFKPELLMFG